MTTGKHHALDDQDAVYADGYDADGPPTTSLEAPVDHGGFVTVNDYEPTPLATASELRTGFGSFVPMSRAPRHGDVLYVPPTRHKRRTDPVLVVLRFICVVASGAGVGMFLALFGAWPKLVATGQLSPTAHALLTLWIATASCLTLSGITLWVASRRHNCEGDRP